jgi:hypothetical protein
MQHTYTLFSLTYSHTLLFHTLTTQTHTHVYNTHTHLWQELGNDHVRKTVESDCSDLLCGAEAVKYLIQLPASCLPIQLLGFWLGTKVTQSFVSISVCFSIFRHLFLLERERTFTKKNKQTRMLFGPKQRGHSGRTPDHCDWHKMKESFDYVQTV